MNQSTIIGLSGGIILLFGMIIVSPESMGAFFNIPGLIVVIGGTLTATFVSRPVRDVYMVLRKVPELFQDEKNSTETDIAQLVGFATWYRSYRLREAERLLENISNPFLHDGLRQVIDGGQLDDLHKSLQWRISAVRNREHGQAHILNTMAVFAPAFGMLGTLFGLVHMLSGLGDSGLSEMGGTMAFAMITTVYGIVAANLFFKPLAIKMERRTNQRLTQMSTLMEGILLVYQKRHPTLIKETLDAMYLHQDIQTSSHGHLSLVKA